MDYYPYHPADDNHRIVGYVLKFGTKYARQINQQVTNSILKLTIELTDQQSQALVIQNAKRAENYADLFNGSLGNVEIEN